MNGSPANGQIRANGAAFTDSGGGAAWNGMAFRRGTDARSIPRIRIPGERARDRSVLVGKLAEILKDQRPTRKVAAMFIDMAFGSPVYERLRALGFNNVFETNFGLVHTPDRTKANMRAYMWDKMKDWPLHGAIETDEKMAMDLAGPGYHINRSNLLVLESKADMQKRGQASPDDGDALALTFAQPQGNIAHYREGIAGPLRHWHSAGATMCRFWRRKTRTAPAGRGHFLLSRAFRNL